MKFIIWDTKDNFQPRRDDDGVIVSDGVLGRIEEDNVYLAIYAEYPTSVRPNDLPVGKCIKDVQFSLSGSKGKYDVYRVS